MKGESLIAALASSCRPSGSDMIADAVLSALKVLAERHNFLTTQAADLLKQIDVLVSAANPALRAAFGVGPDTAAQLLITAGANPGRLRSEPSFAALCGVAPVQASSGKTNRHRLSRGGDRGANNALYRIALVRMSTDRSISPRNRQSGPCSGTTVGQVSLTAPPSSPTRLRNKPGLRWWSGAERTARPGERTRSSGPCLASCDGSVSIPGSAGFGHRPVLGVCSAAGRVMPWG